MPTFSLPIPGSIFLDTLPTLRYALDGETAASSKDGHRRHVTPCCAQTVPKNVDANNVSRDKRQRQTSTLSSLLRVTAAAEYLNVSRGQLRSLAHDGSIPFLRHNDRGPWYFQRDDLDAYVQRQRERF